MPGTPPTTTNLGLPRYAGTDPATFPAQSNAVVDKIDTKAGAVLTASFPSSPAERDEFLYKPGGVGGQPRKMVRIGSYWYDIAGTPLYRIALSGSVSLPSSYAGSGSSVFDIGPTQQPGDHEWDISVAVTGGPTAWTLFVAGVALTEFSCPLDSSIRLTQGSTGAALGATVVLKGRSATGIALSATVVINGYAKLLRTPGF